jgi:hypothetical protein
MFATCGHRPTASFVMALGGDSVAPRNYCSARIKCREIIRIAPTEAAYDGAASTLPKGAARWPMQRDQGQCFIQVEAAVVDRMRAMRRPGESYSQVICGSSNWRQAKRSSDTKRSLASSTAARSDHAPVASFFCSLSSANAPPTGVA